MAVSVAEFGRLQLLRFAVERPQPGDRFTWRPGDVRVVPMPQAGNRYVWVPGDVQVVAPEDSQTSAQPQGSTDLGAAPPVTAEGFSQAWHDAVTRNAPLVNKLQDAYTEALRKQVTRAAKNLEDRAHVYSVVTAAGEPTWAIPNQDEIYEKLIAEAELKEGTDPWRVKISNTVVHDVAVALGLSFDVTNPLLHDAFKQFGQKITNIAEGQRGKIMGLIQRGYDEGLSVPDTAKLLLNEGGIDSMMRATRIARSEFIGGVNGGSLAMAGTVGVKAKTWLATNDAHTREWHAEADGQTVPLNQPFDVDGEAMMFPGDPNGSAENVVNCFPAGTLVAVRDPEKAFRRWYEGPLTSLVMFGGDVLSCTPNHPVLTNSGWKPAGRVVEGDYLVRSRRFQEVVMGDPNVEDMPVSIEKVFDTLSAAVQRVAGSDVDFHGDGILDSEVDVQFTNGELGDIAEAALLEPISEKAFATSYLREGSLLADSLVGQLAISHRLLAPSLLPSPLSSAQLDTVADQAFLDRFSVDAEASGDVVHTLSSEVTLTQVASVEVIPDWCGHVYNLQSGSEVYLANGVTVHNCRCTLVYGDSMNPPPTPIQTQFGPGSPFAPGGWNPNLAQISENLPGLFPEGPAPAIAEFEDYSKIRKWDRELQKLVTTDHDNPIWDATNGSLRIPKPGFEKFSTPNGDIRAVAEYTGNANTVGMGPYAQPEGFIKPQFAKMNGSLRVGVYHEFDMTPEIQARIDALDSAFARTSASTESTTVYRSMTLDMYQTASDFFKPGEVFQEKAYVSTTVDKSVADVYGGKGEEIANITIELPSGSHGLTGADYSQKEIILPRGSKFQVDSVEGTQVRMRLVTEPIEPAPAIAEGLPGEVGGEGIPALTDPAEINNILEKVNKDYPVAGVNEALHTPEALSAVQEVDASSLISAFPSKYEETVSKYREMIQNGEDIGPSTVVRVDGKSYIVDGNHRAEARVLEGQTKIPVQEIKLPSEPAPAMAEGFTPGGIGAQPYTLEQTAGAPHWTAKIGDKTVGIPIDKSLGWSEGFMAKRADAIAQELSKLSPQQLDKITHVVTKAGANPEDGLLAEKYGIKTFKSAANYKDGQLTFYNGKFSPGAIQHEAGHAIGADGALTTDLVVPDSWLLPYQGGPIAPEEWAQAALTDSGYGTIHDFQIAGEKSSIFTPTPGSLGVTKYGETLINEDWAEAIRLYKSGIKLADGTTVPFADVFPNRAKILDELFGKIEGKLPLPEVAPKMEQVAVGTLKAGDEIIVDGKSATVAYPNSVGGAVVKLDNGGIKALNAEDQVQLAKASIQAPAGIDLSGEFAKANQAILADPQLAEAQKKWGEYYDKINQKLWTEKNLTSEEKKIVEGLDKSLGLSPAPSDLVTYRGISDMKLMLEGSSPEDALGKTFESKGFASTTTDSNYAAQLGNGSLVKIEIPQGTGAVWRPGMSELGSSIDPAEKELLLGPGQFRVVSYAPDDLGRPTLTVQWDPVEQVVPPVAPSIEEAVPEAATAVPVLPPAHDVIRVSDFVDSLSSTHWGAGADEKAMTKYAKYANKLKGDQALIVSKDDAGGVVGLTRYNPEALAPDTLSVNTYLLNEGNREKVLQDVLKQAQSLGKKKVELVQVGEHEDWLTSLGFKTETDGKSYIANLSDVRIQQPLVQAATPVEAVEAKDFVLASSEYAPGYNPMNAGYQKYLEQKDPMVVVLRNDEGQITALSHYLKDQAGSVLKVSIEKVPIGELDPMVDKLVQQASSLGKTDLRIVGHGPAGVTDELEAMGFEKSGAAYQAPLKDVQHGGTLTKTLARTEQSITSTDAAAWMAKHPEIKVEQAAEIFGRISSGAIRTQSQLEAAAEELIPKAPPPELAAKGTRAVRAFIDELPNDKWATSLTDQTDIASLVEKIPEDAESLYVARNADGEIEGLFALDEAPLNLGNFIHLRPIVVAPGRSEEVVSLALQQASEFGKGVWVTGAKGELSKALTRVGFVADKKAGESGLKLLSVMVKKAALTV